MMGTATKRDIFSIPATGKSVNILYAPRMVSSHKKKWGVFRFSIVMLVYQAG